jgi:deoxycytidylate deaminase
MSRLSWEEYGCLLALMGKSRSEDPHTKVSAVALDKNGRVLGISYNGLKSGKDIPVWMKREKNRQRKGEMMIHAEANLCSLLKRGECHTICLTISPCIGCCQNLVSSDVKKVIYIKEYHRCNKFKKFFKFHGIKCSELGKKSKIKLKKYINNSFNFVELDLA